jgi:hypothetical protein
MSDYQYTTIDIPNEKEIAPSPTPKYQQIPISYIQQPQQIPISYIQQQQPIYIIQSYIQYVIIPVFIPVPVYNNYF